MIRKKYISGQRVPSRSGLHPRPRPMRTAGVLIRWLLLLCTLLTLLWSRPAHAATLPAVFAHIGTPAAPIAQAGRVGSPVRQPAMPVPPLPFLPGSTYHARPGGRAPIPRHAPIRRAVGAQPGVLQVQAGWNLITPPLVPTTPLSASTVLANLLQGTGGSLAALYGLTNNAWSPSLIEQPGATIGRDYLLTLGAGYLLYSDRAGSFSLSGTVPAAPLSWSLSSGWNLVGLPQGTTGPLSATIVLQSLLAVTSGGLTAVYGLTNNAWSPSLILQGGNHLGRDFIMQPGAGYLLYSDRAAPSFALPGPLPPDPSTVAPPLDTGVSTTVLSATSFLYTGPNPIQTGVLSGTIVLTRAAVLRGRVLDNTGNALPAVTISILNHPEYGQTLSRADGMFDLAVNGGSALTVTYSRQGYLPSQRQVLPAVEDYAWLPDVALLQYDPHVTAIDLTAGAPIQVAQGSLVTDADGSRQATLLFTKGLTATMTLPDGSIQPLTTMHIRATEFTVGSIGHQAMPAELPPSSAYTYAVDFSADEALQAGATGVQFSHPVPVYVQNFLGFPVGSGVPAGSYDASQGKWLPSIDGFVIKIAGVTNGLADLAIDPAGDLATPDMRAMLAISDAERASLAQLYPVGTSLWRIPISHFSDWDFNQGTLPPHDAGPPNQRDPNTEPDPNNPDCQGGSIIECENQTLGENLDLPGTGYYLHYKSNRVPGYMAPNTLTIPLSGATVPRSLKRIDLQISIAGTQLTQSFPPNPDQRYTFTWDGKDAYGRTVQGSQAVRIRIGYVYPLGYSEPASAELLEESFNLCYADPPCRDMMTNIVNAPTILEEVFAYDWLFGHYTYRGTPVSQNDARTELTLWQSESTDLRLGPWDARPTDGLGGWTLNIHHTYDPIEHALYLGDGQRRSAQGLLTLQASAVVKCHIGVSCPYDGPAGSATSTRVSGARGLATGPDGSVYFVDDTALLIRKLAPDGSVTIVGGGVTNGRGFSGDGGPALLAQFNNPEGIAVAPDGSIYIADSYNQRIRRIAPDGTITTVAGSGPAGTTTGSYGGDGGPATAALLNNPTGVALGADGTLYIADYGNNRIRAVGPTGIITTVAGTGTSGFSGDNGPAAGAELSGPTAVALGPDDSIYIADTSNQRIRRVGADGIITTIAGNPSAPNGFFETGFAGDGGLAIDALFANPGGITVSSDGIIYVVDDGNERVRAISPDGFIRTVAGGLPTDAAQYYPPDSEPAGQVLFYFPSSITACYLGCSGTFEGVVVAPDGSLYVADYGNERIWAVNQTLPRVSVSDLVIPSQDGTEVYVFDGTGRHLRTLNALTGAVHYRFSYDAAGRLVAVTDGDGNVTTISRDGSGVPTAIVAPHGQRTALTLDGNGYLARAVDPAGATVSLSYASGGLLTSLTDPRGNLHTFSYDALGRLAEDQNPAGGDKTLARIDGTSGYTVTVTTAQVPTTHYQTSYAIEVPPMGNQERTITMPDGLQRKTVENPDGSTTTTEPDGTGSFVALGADPRWGMQAPLAATQVVSTTGGLLRTTVTTRTVTLADPANPLSLSDQTDQTSVNGRAYSTTFTASTRTAVTTSPLGRQTTTVLDAQGRLVRAQTTGLLPTTYTYDGSGRLTTRIQGGGADARVVQYTYDSAGNVATITDPLGHTAHLEYDADGRVTQETLPDGGVVHYGYDANGNLTSVTPPGRPAHLYSYTATNQVATYTAPDVGSGTTTTQYAYNNDGMLAGVSRPDGQTVAFGYDSAGRLHTVTQARGTTTYAYDPATGNLATITSPDGGTLAYRFDGSLLTGETWSGTIAGSVSRTYDNNLRLTALGVNGTNISYGYDDDNLLTQAGSLAPTRDPQNGLLTGTTLGNVADTQSYNGFGEPAGYSASYNGSAVYADQITRDQAGRIATLTETIGGVTHTYTYTYDPVGRLTEVEQDGAPVEQYTYDGNGNRLTATTTGGSAAGSYDAQDRLTQYGSTTYSYTPNGEVQSATTGGRMMAYSYDALGNLTSAILPESTSITYVLDGENRRIGKKVNGALVQGFLYQNTLNPVAELDGNDNVVSRFIYGSRPNVPDYMVKGGATYRIISDHLGSPRLVIDVATGQIVQRMDYDTFGNVTNDTKPGFQPFGFAGGLYDRDTKLVHFGAREYDTAIGRWTAQDPLGLGQTTNLYPYSSNDPVNLTDPAGMTVIFGSAAAASLWAATAQADPQAAAILNQIANDPNAHLMVDVSNNSLLPQYYGGVTHYIGHEAEIFLNPSEVADLFAQEGLSPNLEAALIHEVAHAWQAFYDPNPPRTRRDIPAAENFARDAENMLRNDTGSTLFREPYGPPSPNGPSKPCP